MFPKGSGNFIVTDALKTADQRKDNTFGPFLTWLVEHLVYIYSSCEGGCHGRENRRHTLFAFFIDRQLALSFYDYRFGIDFSYLFWRSCHGEKRADCIRCG